MDVFIEASRKVTLPFRSENGTVHRHVLWPPDQVPTALPFNRVDGSLVEVWKKDEKIQRLFRDRTLRVISESEAQAYADGESEPAAPEVSPAQVQAEDSVKGKKLAQSAFPTPVRGPSSNKS